MTPPPPPEFLLTHTRAEPPRWTGPRTRFQMVSDVAEGLPDGSHDSSYIYAYGVFMRGWLGHLRWPRLNADKETRQPSTRVASHRVTWPAGWTCAQLVASPVQTADN